MRDINTIKQSIEELLGTEAAQDIHDRTTQRLDNAIRTGRMDEALVIGIGYLNAYEAAVMYETEQYLQQKEIREA